MDSEAKWLMFWAFFIVIACSTVVAAYYIEVRHKEHMAAQGYVQDTLTGKTGVYWVKPENTDE